MRTLIMACALAAVFVGPARAEETQLDRIEHKLDQLLGQMKPPADLSANLNGKAGSPAPAKAEAPAMSAKAPEYLPGPVVFARTYDEKEPPVTDFGGFIADKMSWDDLNIEKTTPVRVGNTQRAYDIEGFLVVKEAGTYQLGVDIDLEMNGGGGPCFATVSLQGKDIGGSLLTKIAASNRITGVATLDPGVYQARIWTGCQRSMNTAHFVPVKKLNFALKIKGPGEMEYRAPRPSEFVHLKKS
jgi:hypothetical protein